MSGGEGGPLAAPLAHDVSGVAVVSVVAKGRAMPLICASLVDGSIGLYDAHTLAELAQPSSNKVGAVALLALPDGDDVGAAGRMLCVGSRDRRGLQCFVVDCTTPTEWLLAPVQSLDTGNEITTHVQLSGSRRLLAYGTDRSLAVFDLSTWACAWLCRIDGDELLSVSCSGAQVWGGTASGEIHVFDAQLPPLEEPAAPAHTLRGHTAPVCCLTSRSATVVSGSDDGRVLVWDAWSLALIDVLVHHTLPITSLSLLPTARLEVWSMDAGGAWCCWARAGTTMSVAGEVHISGGGYASCAAVLPSGRAVLAGTLGRIVAVAAPSTPSIATIQRDLAEPLSPTAAASTQTPVHRHTATWGTQTDESARTASPTRSDDEQARQVQLSVQERHRLLLEAKDMTITRLGQQVAELEGAVAAAEEARATAAERAARQEAMVLEERDSSRAAMAESTRREVLLQQRVASLEEDVRVARDEAARGGRALSERCCTLEADVATAVRELEEREGAHIAAMKRAHHRIEALETVVITLREERAKAEQAAVTATADATCIEAEAAALDEYAELLLRVAGAGFEDEALRAIATASLPRPVPKPTKTTPLEPDETRLLLQAEVEGLRAQVGLLEALVERYRCINGGATPLPTPPEGAADTTNALTAAYVVMQDVLGADSANKVVLDTLSSDVDSESVAIATLVHRLCTLLMQAANNAAAAPAAVEVGSAPQSGRRPFLSPAFETSPPRESQRAAHFDATRPELGTPLRSAFAASGSLRIR